MTTTPHPAPAEKLTAEQEALLRRHAMLMDSTYPLGDGKGFLEASMDDVWSLLDASRAETEAVRRLRDAMETSRDGWWKQAKAHNRAQKELKALAAELVEGLAAYWKIREANNYRIRYGGDPGEEALEQEATLLTKLRDLVVGAHAQGIGGERERGNPWGYTVGRAVAEGAPAGSWTIYDRAGTRIAGYYDTKAAAEADAARGPVIPEG